VLERAPKEVFSREEVRRLLAIPERRLRSWERQKLLPPASTFGFSDLVAIRTLVKLSEQGVPPLRIRLALASLRQKLREVGNPLTELKVFLDGKHIGVLVAGQKMEAISGQLLFDFDTSQLQNLRLFPQKAAGAREYQRRAEAERWFQRGLELEQTGAPIDAIIRAYEKAAELDPASAGALVNLGTVYYNTRDWKNAEEYYKKALKADENYPLAHFNLGNLYDEINDRASALHHYLAAIRLHPSYADAHYNLALLYQSSGQYIKAVRHWRDYLKLDPASSWAGIARRELEKLRSAHVIPGSRDLGAS
jgi:tetratricopeptide (TPR) repeat protein